MEKLIAIGLVVGGSMAVGVGFWGWLGWPAAAVFWGGTALAIGIAEVFDLG